MMVYDIHCLQNRFYFGDSVLPLLVSAIPLFLDVLEVCMGGKGKGKKKGKRREFNFFSIIFIILEKTFR